MGIQILGVGTAVPIGSVTQEDTARLALAMGHHDERMTATLSALYQRTTIQMRHSVLIDASSNGPAGSLSFFPRAVGPTDRGPTTAARMRRYEAVASDLAAAAAARALDDANCSADEIGHLVTVTCSGFSAPGVDIGLIERLGLRRNVSRTNVGFMGCHGALNGLRIAAALGKANPSSKVLLCCVEICTIHHQYTQQVDYIIANALFSDGAAAIVISDCKSQSENWQLLDQQSHVAVETTDVMTWRIGDHGFEMSLSADVPTIIRRLLREWVEDWLFKRGLGLEEIGGWIVHPGGPHILAACGEALDLPPEALEESYGVLAEYGNMSSPTVLFILDRMRHARAKRPCVMLAFGPGLTIEGALFS